MKKCLILSVGVNLISLGVAVASGLEDDLTELDANAYRLYKHGEKDQAVKLWEEAIPYLSPFDPLRKGSELVALHLSKDYYSRLKSAGEDRDLLLKKTIWYLSKAGAYGDAAARTAVDGMIAQINEGEGRDVYRELVLQMAKDDVLRQVQREESLRKREGGIKESDKKVRDAESARQSAESRLKMAEESLQKHMNMAQECEKKLMTAENARQNAERELEDAKKTLEKERAGRQVAASGGAEELKKLEKRYSDLVARAKEDEKAAKDELRVVNEKLRSAQEAIDSLKRHDGNAYYMPPPAGFFRGLGVTIFSPVNYLRSVPQAYKFAPDCFLFALPFVFVWDTAYVVGDLATGLLDVVSLGTFGNVYFTNGTTPWLWERTNDLGNLEDTFHKKD